MKTSTITAKLLMALALATAPVSAATLTVTGIDWNFGQAVDLNANGQSNLTFAGIIYANYENTPLSLFCVDLFTAVGIESFSVNALSVDTVSNGRRAAWLMQTFLPLVANANQAAGLQVAIWDVVHDGGDGLAAGSIQAGNTTAAVVTLADQYVTASEGQSTTLGSVFQHVDGPKAKQQLMSANSFVPAAIGLPIPEPASYLVVGGGLFLLGLVRRKRSA